MDFINHKVNVPELVVFIKIAVSSICVTTSVWCIACAFCSIVDIFDDSPVSFVTTGVVIGLASFIHGTFSPLASIITWLGACINRVYCSCIFGGIASSLSLL
jgi:hypothetical protein